MSGTFLSKHEAQTQAARTATKVWCQLQSDHQRNKQHFLINTIRLFRLQQAQLLQNRMAVSPQSVSSPATPLSIISPPQPGIVLKTDSLKVVKQVRTKKSSMHPSRKARSNICHTIIHRSQLKVPRSKLLTAEV